MIRWVNFGEHTQVPVNEGLSLEHIGELRGDALEHLLDRCRVSDEGSRKGLSLRGYGANGRLDVIRDPRYELIGFSSLHRYHLLVYILRGDIGSTEDARGSEIFALARIASNHHVVWIEHLLCDLGHSHLTERLDVGSVQGGVARQEEVETGEGNKINSHLTEVAVELSREAETTGNA